ncbi:hypothetical protein RHMOL_Rhmol04G0239000 [Rhododendron molle]|uniref:Uncharacterized protein n=1 Tax=Rhododendron molle TaxID=49168 RepID=A0ACC0P4T9_RHOML|nr:hypothetical protein RHMOL_Rhmol04G0239000 [Rhododendron molle]
MNFQYFPPTMEGERITVSLPSAVEAQGAMKWKDCLVEHFVDKKIPFLAVRSVAFKKRVDYGLVDVLSNDKGFYFFQFGSKDAYRQIVESGPWHFGGRLMVLQIWHPDIEYEKERLAKLPIWIQLFNVPLQFWIAEGLSYIASFVGKPLYVDELTETAKRISYANICVEVDVTASLPHSVDLLTACGRKPLVKVVDIPDKGLNAPRGRVWVVKLGGGDSNPTPLAVFEPAVIKPASIVRDIPCSNQFEALQLGDSTIDTSVGVMGVEVVEVSLGSGDSVIQDSLVGAINGSDPSSSKGMEMVYDDTLPDVLGVGMADPDALFQALTSKDMENIHKPNEGKNPRAARRGRKPKQRQENMASAVKKCLPDGWDFVHNIGTGSIARIIVVRDIQGPKSEFTESEVAVLTPNVSDHCPLLVTVLPYKGGRKPFKFFNFWMNHKHFSPMLIQSWDRPVDKVGSPMFILYEKLRRLKPCLKNFNKEFYSDIQNRVKVAREELSNIQTWCAQLLGEPILMEYERLCLLNFNDLCVTKEAWCRQKSRVHWLQLGDNNTKFFHKKVASHRMRNKILSICDENGQRLEDIKDVKGEILSSSLIS